MVPEFACTFELWLSGVVIGFQLLTMNLKKLKMNLNNLRTKLQKEYAEKLIQEAQGDSRRIWSVINDLCNRKVYRSKINRIINENGKKLEKDREIANELNDHFANVGQRLASLITQTPRKTFQEEEVMETIFLEPTSKDEIYKIIIELKNNCSPGHDKIIKKDLIMLMI